MSISSSVRFFIGNATVIMLCALAITLLMLSSGCSKVDSPSSTTANAPQAVAGPDQTVSVGQYAILDGSASTKGGGDTLTYHWTVSAPTGVSVYLATGEAKQTPGFLVEGTYTFTLIVNDGKHDSVPDNVVVTVGSRQSSPLNDANLELCIRYALKMPNQVLSDSLLLAVDSVMVYGFQPYVSSLEGIEKCKNLTWALLGLQSISDISRLATLSSLKHLEIDQNYLIADISPLAELTNLEHLNLQSNIITDISSLKGLTKLQYLNIMDNEGITDISVLSNFLELEELWMQRSPVEDLTPIVGLTKLNTLWFASCGVSDISPISGLTKLKLLVMPTNGISDLSPLANLTDLQYLSAIDNQISDLSPLRTLTNLERLYLTKNNITNILPLVENQGIGSGDAVLLGQNPLDSVSIHVYIPELQSRGATVVW